MRIHRDNIDKLFDYGFSIDTRTIILADDGDCVDDAMANQLMKAMHVLEQKPDPIKILLRSNGGYTVPGMAIYDAIKSSHCHVTIDVYGAAMSMAAVILQAADERQMKPNALLMIHDGTVCAGDDPIRTYENWATIYKRQRRQMYDIFAERSGKSAKYWERKCESDYIMTAAEALTEKLIDKISCE